MRRPEQLLLDAYAAKSCGYALHLERTEETGEELPLSEVVRERMAGGVAFEGSVGEELARLAAPGDLIVLPTGRDRDLDREGWSADRARRLEASLAAIDAGIRLVWNPRLPPDPEGHRSGEPDLLWRVGPSGPRATYLPVDVKAHYSLRASRRETGTHRLEDLLATDAPGEPIAEGPGLHGEDLLQLAHYWRMLDRIDRTPALPPTGGIIGSPVRPGATASLTWFDLTDALADYDAVFADVLAIVERAEAIAAGARLEPLARRWYGEHCHDCGWRALCGPEMLAEQNVSLVKPHPSIWEELDELGVADLPGLAGLEPDRLRPDGRPLSSSAHWGRAIRRAEMALAGDPVPLALLPEVIAGTPSPPRLWRREPLAAFSWEPPRADVELDLDMECVPSHVYLWGSLLTYRAVPPLPGFAPGYRGFGDELPGKARGAEDLAFGGLWSFLTELRGACDAAGRSLALYCYAGASAEVRWLRACAEPRGLGDEIEELVASPAWVDLFVEVSRRLESLGGLGLKVVAKAAGFAWRAEDAGGDASMLWYERATSHADPQVRRRYRERLLHYNEDDVRATWHVREWFARHPAESVPSVPRATARARRRAGR